MMRLGLQVSAVLWFMATIFCSPWQRALAVSLDNEGTLKLGVRTYAATRVGTENTDDNSASASTETFPSSPAGHVRQIRYFVEAELEHDLLDLMEKHLGPLELLNELPVKLESLKYHLTYRGEMDGVYDYGPREYRTSDQFKNVDVVPFIPGTTTPLLPAGFPTPADELKAQIIGEKRRHLRDVAVLRNRLFEAYGELQVGKLFVRFGRQILSWGETDNFRLLDNINPLDSSFGGFLVSLDERRVPLDMLRANYYIGEIGPLSEMFIEGYAAWDKSWAGFPGIPQGSPWQLPNLGAPSSALVTFINRPPNNIAHTRGGGQLKFNAPLPAVGDATFGIAHYYTYFDNPDVHVEVSANRLIPDLITGTAIPPSKDFQPYFSDGAAAHAFQSPHLVQVTGASSTFVIPANYARKIGLGGEPVLRTEFAYFNNEPRFRQSELDPFYFNMIETPDPTQPGVGRKVGIKRVGDSVNFVLGVDMNQFIRFLNPQNSFFFSTQFFYKHLNGATKRGPLRCFAAGPSCVAAVGSDGKPITGPDGKPVLLYADSITGQPIPDGEVLPVPEEVNANAQPTFVHHPVDQYLQTFFIGTSYYSGQVNPSLTIFYDWSGSVVLIPSVTFSRDPFRLTLQYNYLDANRLKGASGTSLLRDRDNFLFQVEYVL